MKTVEPVFGRIESYLFCDVVSLGKNMVRVESSFLLRSSSSSASLNVNFQQQINEGSLPYLCCLAVITLHIVNLSGGPVLLGVKLPTKVFRAFSP